MGGVGVYLLRFPTTGVTEGLKGTFQFEVDGDPTKRPGVWETVDTPQPEQDTLYSPTRSRYLPVTPLPFGTFVEGSTEA